MSNTTLKILALTNSVVRGGKLVEDKAFIVVDEDGNLIGRKQHAVEADAVTEMGELKYYAQGLAFSKATNPELAEKAHVGKAKVVAAFLQWTADGSKPAEVKAETVAETADAAVSTEAVAEEEEDETF